VGLIDHQPFDTEAAPVLIVPFECVRVDDLRWPVDAVWLAARVRVRSTQLAIEAIQVAAAGARVTNEA
jgi:hypothetical protein